MYTYTRSQALVLLRASMLEAISDPPSSLYPLGPFLFTLLPSPSTPEPLPPMSILSPRPKPLNASAGAHVHPNRLYLHLIASSKVLLSRV